MSLSRRKSAFRPERTATRHLIAALVEGDKSLSDLQEVSGFTWETVRNWIALFHDKLHGHRRMVHISGWRVEGNSRKALYSWCAGAEEKDCLDCPRPAKRSHSERSKAYRAREKAKQAALVLAGKGEYYMHPKAHHRCFRLLNNADTKEPSNG